jgi:hypothetical protein
MLLRRGPNFFCRNLHVAPPIPDFFYGLFTLHRPLRFCSISPASQACLATIFKPKRKMFLVGHSFTFPGEIITN